MNFSSVLGIVAALAVFFIAVFTATPAWKIFLDFHGILIVVGGTAAAALICFPASTFWKVMKVFVKKVIGKYSKRHQQVIDEIVDLARGYREDPNYLQNQAETIKTPFLKEAIELQTLGGMKDHVIDAILKKRALTQMKKYEEDAEVFKTIGRFPPAFGLMGTTLGMIALLQNLGTPDSFKRLGPAMAIGLVATLYGIALANLVFLPIGENLAKLNREDELLREIIIDGIKLVRAKEHPLVVEEHLKSYLLPAERKPIQRAA